MESNNLCYCVFQNDKPLSPKISPYTTSVFVAVLSWVQWYIDIHCLQAPPPENCWPGPRTHTGAGTSVEGMQFRWAFPRTTCGMKT